MKRLLRILRRVAQTLLLAAISVGITLFLLELAVRWIAPQQLITLRPDIWQPAETFGWRHAPDADTSINVGEGNVHWRTDAQGHRVGEPPPAGDSPCWPSYRILALGDSFVEAIQVAHEDTTTAQLEVLLSTELVAPVQVTNTGVGGWGPNQYLLEAQAVFDQQDEQGLTGYDALVVFIFVGNDRVHQRRSTYSPNQVAAPRRLRFPHALSKRELIDAVAYPINNALERRSHLFTLLKHRAKFLLMRVGLSAHHFPTALIPSMNGPNVDGSEAWDLTVEVLVDIRTLADARGLPMLVVLLPGVYQVDAALGARYAQASGLSVDDYDLALPSSLLAPALDAAGLTWIDALPRLRQAHEDGSRAGKRPELYGSVDTHLAPTGHRIVAEAILPWAVEHLGRRDLATAEWSDAAVAPAVEVPAVDGSGH